MYSIIINDAVKHQAQFKADAISMLDKYTNAYRQHAAVTNIKLIKDGFIAYNHSDIVASGKIQKA